MKLQHYRPWTSRLSKRWQPHCRRLHQSQEQPADRNENAKISEPLRILFCGSDDFSVTSLRALEYEKRTNPSLIQSIDVVCRPDKRTGRGLKLLRQLPIKAVTNTLNLPLHEIDSARTWSTPSYITLVIAVSFGLLIPSQVINRSKYGGLNLHPSFLPDLAGPAPLHHTLLRHRPVTGLTLQTLHPTAFDKGAVLARTKYPPGIPVPKDTTPAGLAALLAPLGAEMLIAALRGGLYGPLPRSVPGLTPSQMAEITGEGGVAKAGKITRDTARVEWDSLTAEEVLTRVRVLGSVWDEGSYGLLTRSGETKRIVYEKLERVGEGNGLLGEENGSKMFLKEGRLMICTWDGFWLECVECTVEGGRKGEGVRDMERVRRRVNRRYGEET